MIEKILNGSTKLAEDIFLAEEPPERSWFDDRETATTGSAGGCWYQQHHYDGGTRIMHGGEFCSSFSAKPFFEEWVSVLVLIFNYKRLLQGEILILDCNSRPDKWKNNMKPSIRCCGLFLLLILLIVFDVLDIPFSQLDGPYLEPLEPDLLGLFFWQPARLDRRNTSS